MQELTWQERVKENRPTGPMGAVEMNPGADCAANAHTIENRKGWSREEWRAFEKRKNTMNSNRKEPGGLRQEQRPSKRQKLNGSGDFKQEISGSSYSN